VLHETATPYQIVRRRRKNRRWPVLAAPWGSGPKERRNSEQDGTHPRKSGGFFTPRSRGVTDANVCVGRAA